MPVTVALVDAQSARRLNTFSLLARDSQLMIDRSWCFHSPEALITWLIDSPLRPDVILFDLDCGGFKASIEWLREQLWHIRQLRPRSRLVCMTNHIDDDLICLAANAKATGYIVRRDVGYGVPALVTQATQHAAFVCSPSVEERVHRYVSRRQSVHCIPHWRLYDKLTPKEQTVAELLFISGLTPATVSQLTQLGQPSVHTYKQRVRKKVRFAVEEGYYDSPRTSRLAHQSKLSDSDVFHLLTRLPQPIVH